MTGRVTDSRFRFLRLLGLLKTARQKDSGKRPQRGSILRNVRQFALREVVY